MKEISEVGQAHQNDVRALAESYHQLAALCPDAIAVEVEQRIVFANSAMLEILGAPGFDEFLGKSFFNFVDGDSRLLLQQRCESLRQDGQPLTGIALRVQRTDGTMVEIQLAAGLLMWRDGNAVQFRLRHSLPSQCEIELRESEARFHQLADAMPQIVWMATADGEIDYRNRKWFEQTGLTEEQADAVGGWNAILHPDDAPPAAEKWSSCVQDGRPFEMEYRYLDCRSGGYRWHLGRALPVKNTDGHIVRWFGTCTDIHDQKILELALQQAKEQLANSAGELERRIQERTIELEETVRSSEALNYSIAHDLRAPLRAMSGFAGALMEEYGPKLDLQGRDYAQRITESVKRMDRLIGSLLAYGRLNYEELSLGFVDANGLIENLLKSFNPEIRATGCHVAVMKPLPKVWANTNVLKKVIAEIIENALKFHDEKRPFQIEIWAEEEETKSLIFFRDTGIGISPEHHERIFRILESLHVSDRYPGTGIGLAIARRGMERMNGTIGLKSTPGEGSCFWIELPKALV